MPIVINYLFYMKWFSWAICYNIFNWNDKKNNVDAFVDSFIQGTQF